MNDVERRRQIDEAVEWEKRWRNSPLEKDTRRLATEVERMKRAPNGSVPRDLDDNFKSSYKKLMKKYALLKQERAEVGECCTRFENSWKLAQDEVTRINKILERMAQARHIEGVEKNAETLVNIIDNTLTVIFGAPENRS